MKTRQASEVIRKILNKIEQKIEEKAKRAYPDELLKYYCEDTLDLFREAYIKGYKEGFRVGGNKMLDWIEENNSEDHFVKVNEKVESDYVDLGLPSGTLWATCNVGAEKPEECGNYFAWDDVIVGVVRPTQEQFWELTKECESVWTTQNGINGRLFTGPNGNTLFLPAAGQYIDTLLYYAGGYGGYWSRTLYGVDPSFACYLGFNLSSAYCDYGDRYNRRAVRAVKK